VEKVDFGVIARSEATKQSSRAPAGAQENAEFGLTAVFWLARFARTGLLRFARNDG
jgi:hypothetical protein